MKQDGDQTVIDQCCNHFWLCPASDLGAMMPGLLDEIDSTYKATIINSQGSSPFNSNLKPWKKTWKKYSKQIIQSFEELEENTTWLKVPKRALARFAFFLNEMGEVHHSSVFPTASFIKDLEDSLQSSRLAFTEVCVSFSFLGHVNFSPVLSRCACGPMD